VGSEISFQGGYNNATNTQTGETFYDGQNSRGRGLQIYTLDYVVINYLNFYRYYRGVYVDTFNFVTVSNARIGACGGSAVLLVNGQNLSIGTISSMNNGTGGYGIDIGNCSIITITTIRNCSNCNVADPTLIIEGVKEMVIGTISEVSNNAYAGIDIEMSFNITIGEITSCIDNDDYGLAFAQTNSRIFIRNLTTSGNGADVGIYVTSLWTEVNLFNSSIGESTEVEFEITSWASNSRINSQKHDQTANYHRIWSYGGDVLSQAATRPGASGLEWSLYITDSVRDINLPLNLSIAKIAVEANKLVTVKAYFKKSHATDIGAKLVCRGGQIGGVPSDVTATKANDTNFEELTITFTPNEAGVVEIEAWEYYISDVGEEVLVDTMTITQAA
jgi:hypothetical protein